VSWLSRVFRKGSGDEAITLLRLRTTRFRQLLGSYAALLALLEDSAEKQGGNFILDRQYVLALAEQVTEIADAIVFDLNVITFHRNLAFYEAAERLRTRLRSILAQGSSGGGPGSASDAQSQAGVSPTVSPSALAAALERSEVVYQQSGHVACRGVAAGPVCNLSGGTQPGAMSPGSVLVASDVDAEGAAVAAGRAGAILLDRGSAAGTAARLARELRIPAIVGLGDVTSRLASGVEVTVDADENVIYQGRVSELLEYYRSGRSGGEEEEYHLLRSVREVAFPLTFSGEGDEPSLKDCRTVRDLAHLAHSLAGDALWELLSTERGDADTLVRLEPAWCEARVVQFEDLRPPGTGGGVLVRDVRSRPLRAFLEGLANHGVSDQGPGAPRSRPPAPCALRAAATDEHVLAVMTSPRGFDMVDATVGGGRESNTVYCRFAARGDDDPEAVRGGVAAGVLARLGFSVALTVREASGWLRGLPWAETEERVRILGCLFERLARPADTGRHRAAVQPSVEAFMSGCA
jgi:phosphohistidine swiveling domain-containing protein